MMRLVPVLALSILIGLAVSACGSNDDSGATVNPVAESDAADLDAESDTSSQDALAEDVAPDDAGSNDGSLDADLFDADVSDGAGEADATAFQFDGIWRKTALGDDLIVENDCGAFWIMDFDYEYTRFERAGDTLTVSYCEDETCSVVDSITQTMSIAGNTAEASDPSMMDLPGCVIEIASTTRLTLESDDTGRVRWERGLSYVGGSCDAYKDPAMTGDTCSAVAEGEIVRFE